MLLDWGWLNLAGGLRYCYCKGVNPLWVRMPGTKSSIDCSTHSSRFSDCCNSASTPCKAVTDSGVCHYQEHAPKTTRYCLSSWSPIASAFLWNSLNYIVCEVPITWTLTWAAIHPLWRGIWRTYILPLSFRVATGGWLNWWGIPGNSRQI